MYITKEAFRAMASNRNWDTVILRVCIDKKPKKQATTKQVVSSNLSGEEK
jgi:hypothetical protein